MLPSQYAPHLHEVDEAIMARVRQIRELQQRRLDMLDDAARALVKLSEFEDSLGRLVKDCWPVDQVQAAVRAVR